MTEAHERVVPEPRVGVGKCKKVKPAEVKNPLADPALFIAVK
jgi:hypothetical protein